MRTSIRARGQMESVPVKRRRFREPVRDIDAHRFAGRHFQGRPEICAVDADGRRLAIFEESREPGLEGKIELTGASNALSDKRSEEHTSELQSLMRISYAVFCLKQKSQENNKP